MAKTPQTNSVHFAELHACLDVFHVNKKVQTRIPSFALTKGKRSGRQLQELFKVTNLQYQVC